jgi:hypothetical protein
MDNNSKTVKIIGIEFLTCQQEYCEWNVGWLGGTDWTEEPGSGTRICNLGAKAMIETGAVPPDHCQRSTEVLEVALSEFQP